MGVAGAAIATVISHAVSFILAIWYLGRDGKLLDLRGFRLRLDKELTRKTLVVGLPSGVQQTIVSLGIMAMSSIVNSFGTAVVAAFGAASRLDQFAMMPAQSLALATSTVAGQNIGARKYGRVKQSTYMGMSDRREHSVGRDRDCPVYTEDSYAAFYIRRRGA